MGDDPNSLLHGFMLKIVVLILDPLRRIIKTRATSSFPHEALGHR